MKPSKYAEFISTLISNNLNLTEMRLSRGKNYKISNQYQIRFKPNTANQSLNQVYSFLQTIPDISELQENLISANSSKFASISFKYKLHHFDVVFARGANKGESFEANLLSKLNDFLKGIYSEEAETALSSIENIDSECHIDNIFKITNRSGSTKRSNKHQNNTGKIIADLIIILKSGEERYISLKDTNGKTIGQFGCAKAFTDDLKVDVYSDEWVTLLAPLKLNPKKIEEGLKINISNSQENFQDTELLDYPIIDNSSIYNLIKRFWGTNYYFLKKSKFGFKSLIVNDEYHQKILKNLKITKVNYPCLIRKQINIYLSSDVLQLKLEIRNPRGKSSIKPTQIQLSILAGL